MLLLKGFTSGGGFRLFLAPSFALAKLAVLPENLGDEGLLVLRTALIDDFVSGTDRRNGLEELLQPAFWIVVGGVDFEVFEEFACFRDYDPADGDEVAVEIHGPDQGLESVGEGTGAGAAAVGFLAPAHHDVAAEIEPVSEQPETVAGDDPGADFGEVAFREVRKLVKKILGKDEL